MLLNAIWLFVLYCSKARRKYNAGAGVVTKEYSDSWVAQTSDREITAGLDKPQIMKLLKLLDKNDPSERKVRNYALLMFCDKPELYIDHSYTEVIVDMFGTKRRMESKTFTGPLWKQYRKIVEYINDKYLSTLVIRDES